MALKKFYKSKDQIPTKYIDEYRETEEGYVLKLDDDDGLDDLTSKLDEFRTNNRNLFNEKKLLVEKMEQFKDVDPEKYQQAVTAMAELEKMKEQNLIDAGKLDEVVAQRTERMRQDFEGKVDALNKQVESLTSERDTYKGKLQSTLIDSSIQAAVGEVAVPRQGAMRHVLTSAREIWTVDEKGNLVPMQDGKVKYGKDGQNPLTTNEWVESFVKEASYLFEPNSGGGGSGGEHQQRGSEYITSDGNNISGIDLEKVASGETVIELSE